MDKFDDKHYTTDFPDKMPPDIRKALDAIIPSARMTLEETGDVPPVLNVRENDNFLVFDVRDYMRDTKTKNRLAIVMEIATKKPGVQWLCLVSEVWVGADRKAKSYMDIPAPSEDPKRTEAVSYMVSSPRGDWMGLSPIVRQDGKPPTFHKVFWHREETQTEGRFVGFYKKGGTTT